MGVQGKVVSITSHCDVWSIQADVVDYESQPKVRLKVSSANEVSIRGCGGGDGPQWGLGAEISWGRGGGQMERKLVCFGGSVMRMMQGFLADDASDVHVFGKEPLPIVGENVIKICIIWRAGDVNDASI